jgi:hypothetical protein
MKRTNHEELLDRVTAEIRNTPVNPEDRVSSGRSCLGAYLHCSRRDEASEPGQSGGRSD